MISELLTLAVMAIYLIATCAFVVYLKSLSTRSQTFGQTFLLLGCVGHLILVALQVTSSDHFFPRTASESHLLFTLVMALGCLGLARRKSFYIVLIVLLPVIALGLLLFHRVPDDQVWNPLPSPWLWTHILMAIAGEAVFCLAAAISFVYLLAERQLRRKYMTGFFAKIPSLAQFDVFLGEILTAGFILLSLALMLGAFFAREYWPAHWYWQPQIVFSGLIWILYAVLMILRRWMPVYRGHRSAVIAVVGFCSILLLSASIHYGFSPLHSGRAVDPREKTGNP